MSESRYVIDYYEMRDWLIEQRENAIDAMDDLGREWERDGGNQDNYPYAAVEALRVRRDELKKVRDWVERRMAQVEIIDR